MAAFDSIVNVDEWISDHYLTTDDKGASFTKRVKACVKDWKTGSGEFAGGDPWERFKAHRGAIQRLLAELSIEINRTDESSPQVLQLVDACHTIIREALGYAPATEVSQAHGSTTMGFTGSSTPNSGLVTIDALPVDDMEDLVKTTPRQGLKTWTAGKQDSAKSTEWTTGKLVGELFLADNPSAYIVVFAGSWILLAERESWPLGRYLAIDIRLAVDRNDQQSAGELQRIVTALARENTSRAADGTTWWDGTINESREHAVKVSEELRGAVKQSIEIIGNDVLTRYRQQNKHDQLEALDGNELAKQALRYLYRILFLLFAEARPELNILPTGAPEYDEGYGLSRLRDLVLSPPESYAAKQGTHLYESMQVLFDLVNNGHEPSPPPRDFC